MGRRGMLGVVLAVWVAVPAVALGAVARPGEVSALGDPVVFWCGEAFGAAVHRPVSLTRRPGRGRGVRDNPWL